MRIFVRLAEPFWRTVGQREMEVELAENARITDLLAYLFDRYPPLKKEMAEAPPVFFVGEDEAYPETPLLAGSRVHIVWPIAGGGLF